MFPEYKYKQIYNPKSNRLQNYDYGANGGYFITICTKNRENYFGEIIDGKMILNQIGEIVYEEIKNIPILRKNVLLDEFIIMPNHLHMILIINNNEDIIKNGDTINRVSTDTTDTDNDREKGGIIGNKNVMLNKKTIGFVIRQLKRKSTFQINKFCRDTIYRVSEAELQIFAWQSNYYDRIIRDEDEMQRIRKYILENPLKWELDKNNEENLFM